MRITLMVFILKMDLSGQTIELIIVLIVLTLVTLMKSLGVVGNVQCTRVTVCFFVLLSFYSNLKFLHVLLYR